MELLAALPLQVNPVPWARAQMAFTLMFHIILVPLGVSWSAMTLIANFRAIRRGDADAMRLAQRWSSSPRPSSSRSTSTVGGGSNPGRISGPAYRSPSPVSSAALQ